MIENAVSLFVFRGLKSYKVIKINFQDSRVAIMFTWLGQTIPWKITFNYHIVFHLVIIRPKMSITFRRIYMN